MAQKTTSRYCEHCDKRTLAVGNGPNHVLHLLLSIITVGLWLFVWGFLICLPTTYRCSKCGTAI